jgi:hypothetical protein
MARLIIEQTGRSGSPGLFHPVDAFPLRIGRAPDNDIIVADPFVSPHHLTIEESDSGWIVTDQGSTNGTFVGRGMSITGPRELGPGSQIQIGRTLLRLYSSSQEVPPALPIKPRHHTAPGIAIPLVSIVSILAVFGVALTDRALDAAIVTRPISLFAGALPLLFFPLIWAGVWSLAGFIVKRNGDFGKQLIMANGAFLLFFLIAAISEYVDFFASSVPLADVTRYAGFGLLSTGLLVTCTRIATGFIDLRRVIIAFSIGGGIIALLAVSDHARYLDNKITPVYSRTLKPPYAPAGRAVPLDEFFEECEKTFGK